MQEKKALIFAINNWFENFGRFVVKNKNLFIITSLLLIAISAFGLRHLKIGLDLDKYFTKNDPILVGKQIFSEKFGNNDFIGVLVDADSVFDRNILKAIREVSAELKDSVPFADEVISITNLQYIVPVKSIRRSSKPIFNTADINIDSVSDGQLRQIVNLFDNREGVKGRLYAHDYKQTWILLKLNKYPEKADWDKEKSPIEYVGGIASAIVDKYNLKYKDELKSKHFKLTAAGTPVIAYKRNKESLAEMIWIVSLAALVAILLIILMTRSFKASIGIITTVAGALIVVFGIKGYMGETVDSAFMLIPILLTIAVSVAYSIHFTAYYKKMLWETKDSKEAVIQSMKKNGWPIFFASLTTVFALSSFLFVPITTIQWAGTSAALSIFIVFILLMFFYPAVLASGKNNKNIKQEHFDKFWDRILTNLAEYVLVHSKGILIVFTLVVIIMGFFASRVEVNLHPKKMFGTKMQHAKEMVYVSESPIATNYSYNVVLNSNDTNFFKKLENAQKIVEIEKEIRKSSTVNKVSAFPEKIGEMYQALKGDDNRYNKLPEKQGLYNSIRKRLERYTEKQMRGWVDEDYTTSQIFVSLPDFKSKVFVTHIDSIKTKIDELFPIEEYPNFETHFTGYAIQFSKMNQYVTVGLVRSFGISLLLIFLLMSIAFSSIRLGLIAMIPNVAPVIVAGGVMGLLNMPLEFVTMTIAPMILGLAVDNTIHFINGTKLYYLENRNYDNAIRMTYKTVGQALLKSSIILCCTLLAFTVAKMNNMVNMGFLTVIAIITATITDFMVTPTIIRLIKPFDKKVKK